MPWIVGRAAAVAGSSQGCPNGQASQALVFCKDSDKRCCQCGMNLLQPESQGESKVPKLALWVPNLGHPSWCMIPGLKENSL